MSNEDKKLKDVIKNKIYYKKGRHLVGEMKGKNFVEWLKSKVDIYDEESIINSDDEFWNQIISKVKKKK